MSDLETPLLSVASNDPTEEPLSARQEGSSSSTTTLLRLNGASEPKEGLDTLRPPPALRLQSSKDDTLFPPGCIPDSSPLAPILRQHETTWEAFWDVVETIVQNHRDQVRIVTRRAEKVLAYFFVAWVSILVIAPMLQQNCRGDCFDFYAVFDATPIINSGSPCVGVILIISVGLYQGTRRATLKQIEELCKHYSKKCFGQELSLSFQVRPRWSIRVSRQDGQAIEQHFCVVHRNSLKSGTLDANVSQEDDSTSILTADYYQEHQENDAVLVFRLKSYLMDTCNAPPPLPPALQGKLSAMKWKEFWKGLTIRLRRKQPLVLVFIIFWVVMLHICLCSAAYLAIGLGDVIYDSRRLDPVPIVSMVILMPLTLCGAALSLFCMIFARIFEPVFDPKAVHEYCRHEAWQMLHVRPEMIFYDDTDETWLERLDSRRQTIKNKRLQSLVYFWNEEYDCELRLS